jgi:glucokinase
MPTESKRYAVGVDLGGTNIVFAVTDLKAKALCKLKMPTLAQEGSAAVIGRIAKGVEEVLVRSKVRSSQIQCLGIGSPGPLNARTGVVYDMPNLPGFHNLPLRDLVQGKTGFKSFLENDAKAAALGEKWAGAARGVENMIMLTLGTGIGGAILLKHELYAGADNSAGEFGHMVIDPDGPLCGCGRRGCLERYASATALVATARQALSGGTPSLLRKLSGGRPEAVTSLMVHQAVKRGDKLAKKLWAELVDRLGTGIANLINIFNPDCVVLGGGLMLADHDLLLPLRANVRSKAFAQPARRAKIIAAKLGEDAGVIGAAAVGISRSGKD